MENHKKAWNWTLDDNKYLTVGERIAPTVDIFNEPTRCFRVNEEWCVYVAGAISELLNIKSWQGAENELAEPIQQILKMLQGETCGEPTMDCEDVVDCMENDPDYLALQSMILSQSSSNTQQHMQDLADDYDGSPQSIAPLVPATPPDATAKNALCYALNAYVELFAATKTGLIQQKNFLQITWTRIRAAINGAFFASLDLFAPIYTPNLFDCWVDDDEALTALADAAALEAVACCLYDYLSVFTMSETAFNDAITTCAMSLTGTAGDIACLLSNENDEDIYLMFLETYNDALQAQIDGDILPACPCAPATGWCYLADFTLSNDGFSPVTAADIGGGVATARGQWNASGYWENTLGDASDGSAQNGIIIYLDAGATISADYARIVYSKGTTTGTQTLNVGLQETTNPETQNNIIAINQPLPSQDHTEVDATVTKSGRYWRITMTTGSANPVGFLKVFEVEISSSTGTNPFGVDNC